MMRKAFPLDIKSFSKNEGGERSFEGYASTFGNKDRTGDIVVQGAFVGSIQKHMQAGRLPAMLLHHDMHRPIGVWEEMAEDSGGLRVRGRLTSGVKDADEAYALLKDGALHSMSIGYIPVVEEYDSKDDTNYIKEIDLWEVSLVTIPANSAALVGAVKDADGELNVREIEKALRDAGLTRREAKALIAVGIKGLREDDTNGSTTEPAYDQAAIAALIQSIRE